MPPPARSCVYNVARSKHGTVSASRKMLCRNGAAAIATIFRSRVGAILCELRHGASGAVYLAKWRQSCAACELPDVTSTHFQGAPPRRRSHVAWSSALSV